MFRNVVVGVNGSTGGRDAIALATGLLAKDGNLALAHVHGGDARTRTVSPEFALSERTRSRELLEAARSETAIEAGLLLTGSSSVGRGLHEIVERHGADLLVVGSRSRGLFGRVMVGDHIRGALNGASCAVAVAPAGYAQRPAVLLEIGVGYDGSPESEHALAVALELSRELGARVSAFEAIDLPAGRLSGPGPADESIDRHLAEARERIASLGVAPHVAYGDAAEELALYGASVDLLIVGSRGYGPLGRLVHGSTSQRLAQTARCPLLVLPRAAESREAPNQTEADNEATASAAS